MDKPAGLAVDEDVVPLAARELAPKGGRAWPRIVHRLDRGTSGCLLLALRKETEEELKRAFDQGLVEKTYLALVEGSPPDRAELDTPYGPDPNDRHKFTTHVITPRRARLGYEVAERLRGAALLRVKLDTGRTHQIRVQLASIGHPVVGDRLYGAPAEVAGRPPLGRYFLHAASIRFAQPSSGQPVLVSAPLPPELELWMQGL